MPMLSIPCAKGCGHNVPTDEQTLANAKFLGVQLTVEHADGECPTDDPPEAEAPAVTRRFRVQLVAMEILGADPPPETEYVTAPDGVEVLAGLGETFTADSFAEAVNGPATAWLNTAWTKFQENAQFADLPGGSTTPGG